MRRAVPRYYVIQIGREDFAYKSAGACVRACALQRMRRAYTFIRVLMQASAISVYTAFTQRGAQAPSTCIKKTRTTRQVSVYDCSALVHGGISVINAAAACRCQIQSNEASRTRHREWLSGYRSANSRVFTDSYTFLPSSFQRSDTECYSVSAMLYLDRIL